MKNLLFPTDFSEDSLRCFSRALKLATRLDVKLTVMNVYQSTLSPRRPFIGERYVQHEVLKKLADFVRRGQGEEVWKRVSIRAREGQTAATLVEASKSGLYDMIVIGRSKSYDWLTRQLGSTTTYVAEKAFCPVLILPPHRPRLGLRKLLVYETVGSGVGSAMSDYVRKKFRHLFEPLNSETDNATWIRKANRKDDLSYTELMEGLEKMQIDLIALQLKEQSWQDQIFRTESGRRIALESPVPVLVFNDYNLDRSTNYKGRFLELNDSRDPVKPGDYGMAG